MSACNDERLAAREELLAQQRGHGCEGNSVVENALHFRIATRKRIADDDQVRGGIEIGFGVRLKHRNAKIAKDFAHGRIGRFVRTCNTVALQL